MAFASGDYLRILKALNWHYNKANEVKLALSDAETDSDRESAILATLTNLEGVKTRFQTVRAGDNASLIKADVLEWDANNRVNNFYDQMNELQQELANLLGLDWGWTRPGLTYSVELKTYG
ncbi:MAG: hypothetical protein MK111_13820 [Crocosphaera sp.]|nr:MULTISPECIES: hypothetical protein [Crocosphaera]MCH2245698.1 hypothetical protein [Crocosphaera sp.]